MARAELHLHLEGTVEPATIRELDPSLSEDEIAERYRFTDFGGFIAAFRWISQRLRTPEDYARITSALCQRLREQDIAYAEITLAAGVVIWKEQDLPAVYDAVHRAALASPVEVRWNLDSIRQFGPELAQKVAEFAATRAGRGVVSVGIGGDEAAGPAEWFADVYRYARDRGLRLTAHAGETAGPASIWSALEIGAERIGHGIRAVDDPVLLAHLAKHRIPLEISMFSNVATGAVSSLAAHPIRKLYDAGVPITLNTDDPALFGNTLADEFALAKSHFGFTDSELDRVRRNAFDFRFS
ncbi:MAG: adenosine deaminase [Acidobacteriota bacterium]|nr:adenosine deaminase [Acidobacteriota bacterium]